MFIVHLYYQSVVYSFLIPIAHDKVKWVKNIVIYQQIVRIGKCPIDCLPIHLY